jgi:hypothetical protein
MNFLKKGPELKLSEIKVPGFVEDVYYDLKERHLLPIVALLVIGIIAAPIFIGGSDGDAGEAEAVAPAAGASAATSESAQLVAKSAPGLRDYRRRLQHLQPKDPFVQQYEKKEEGEGGGSTAGSSESTETGDEFSGGETFPTAPGSTEPGGEEGADEDGLKYFSFAIDVRITGGGQEGPRKSTVRRNLPELTMLPSRATPAIVYMGSTKDGKKAVMTVSSDVQAIFGDAKCALGSERCELLIMEEGLPETFVYGGAGRTYKIELLKIHLVESDKLNRAPLGEPKQKSGKKNAG